SWRTSRPETWTAPPANRSSRSSATRTERARRPCSSPTTPASPRTAGGPSRSRTDASRTSDDDPSSHRSRAGVMHDRTGPHRFSGDVLQGRARATVARHELAGGSPGGFARSRRGGDAPRGTARRLAPGRAAPRDPDARRRPDAPQRARRREARHWVAIRVGIEARSGPEQASEPRRFVTLEIAARGVAVVTVRREPVNAMNPELLDELDGVVSELHDRVDVRSVIFTSGLPGFFMVGLDLAVVDAAIGDDVGRRIAPEEEQA